MFKVTFVCGGGKKVRQRYYEEMTKDIFSSLSTFGFTEDRGAHCHLSCQGTMKYQHDLDKDLKFGVILLS